MNSDRWRGKWKQFKGLLQQRSGRLLCNVAMVEAGHRQYAAGRLQQAYGRGLECEPGEGGRGRAAMRSTDRCDSEQTLRARNG